MLITASFLPLLPPGAPSPQVIRPGADSLTPGNQIYMSEVTQTYPEKFIGGTQD